MGRQKRKSRKKVRRGPGKAETADRHELYEQSVQNVEDEVEFLQQTFREIRGRDPELLREDFCGTANAACQWIRVNARHRAVGVDIDEAVIDWGRQRHVAGLTAEQQERLTILNTDVLTARTEPSDLTVAFNFSYWIFKTRDLVRRYFRAVRDHLKDDGLFFLDAFGGSEAYDEMSEKTRLDGFTYIWDQASFDPVSADFVCHIHFRFPDGSRLEKAFSYDWRLWTLPEIRELLAEAGFSKSTVYWEEDTDDDEEEGDYVPVERGVADPAWIAYVVAEK